MAVSTKAWSPKEFSIAIGAEVTVGTASQTMKMIEAEGMPSLFTYNDIKATDQRQNSSYRALTAGDVQSIANNATSEATFSGFLDTTIFPLLLENAMGVEFASGKAIVGYQHNPTSFAHAAGSSGAHNTVSLGIQGATTQSIGDTSFLLKACVCTSLTVSGDVNEDGGRLKFDASFMTKTPPGATLEDDNTGHFNGNPTDYTEAYLYMSQFTENGLFYGAESLIESFSITISNPVSFLGNIGGATGTPESYLRSVPSLDVTGNVVMKYDDSNENLASKHKALTLSSTKAGFYLGSDPTVLAGNNTVVQDDTTGLGFLCNHVIITDLALEEGDFAKWNASFKSVQSGSNALLQVLQG